jgi:hypothetical protein
MNSGFQPHKRYLKFPAIAHGSKDFYPVNLSSGWGAKVTDNSLSFDPFLNYF